MTRAQECYWPHPTEDEADKSTAATQPEQQREAVREGVLSSRVTLTFQDTAAASTIHSHPSTGAIATAVYAKASWSLRARHPPDNAARDCQRRVRLPAACLSQ